MAQHDLGTADPVKFEEWRSKGPSHAIAFARAWAAWEQVDAAHRDDADIISPTEDTGHEGAWSSRRGVLRVAAASGMILAAGGLVTTRAYAWSSAETGVGETRRLHLPDGSVMMLNTDSAVSWRFHNEGHNVWLERGEIALEVAPTSSMLRLSGAKVSAQLSAGRFNARLQSDGLDVLVIRGVAQSPGKTANAGAMAAHSQSLLLTDSAAKVQAASSQLLAATTAWPTGEILLHDEPLSSAVSEYNRYLPLKIVIADADLGKIRVGGRFTSTDPTAFLEALHTTLNIRVQTTANGYILSGKNFT